MLRLVADDSGDIRSLHMHRTLLSAALIGVGVGMAVHCTDGYQVWGVVLALWPFLSRALVFMASELSGGSH